MLPASTRQWPRYVGAFLVIVLMAGVASAVAAIRAIPVAKDGGGLVGSGPKIDKKLLANVKPGDPQTLLLIGSDKRSSNSSDGKARSGQLSDTIMLAHLDSSRPTTLMSIPRDTQVNVTQKDGSVDTEKINAAFAQGGAPLTVKVVTQLLHIPISHVVVTNFLAFQEAVNRLGCLYEDIDRSYFNDNASGVDNYSAIDVKSGYQLLCGADTLEWVRFRHTDSDLVRAARQQAFLRSAKGQVAASKLFKSSSDLFKIFEHYTETDLDDRGEVLSLLKLAINSSKQPIRSVNFQVEQSPTNSNLLVTPAGLAEMKKEFLAAQPETDLQTAPKGSTKQAKKPKAKKRTGLAKGLVTVPSEKSSPQLIKASFDLAAGHLPMYYPSARLATGGYANLDPVRTYTIKAGRYSKRSYPAFRLTYSMGQSYLGQYYGLQGTTWKDAPILKQTHSTVQRGGKTLMVYKAGSKYQLVAWQTPKAVYWISNSVSLALGNSQMLDIAASLTKVAG
ncbi:MAG: LCP family protein [Solirubrobacteraceae bacterium]